MDKLFHPDIPWWHLVIRSVVVYIAVLMMMRLGGKRQVGQMGMNRFVAILLISNSVQNAMNGGDNSITGGLISAIVLMLLSAILSFVTYHSKDWDNFIQGRPTLLIHHGRLIRDNLRRELLTLRELKVLLRKQGCADLSEIEEAVLESDGFISITRKAEPRELEEVRPLRRAGPEPEA